MPGEAYCVSDFGLFLEIWSPIETFDKQIQTGFFSGACCECTHTVTLYNEI